MIILGNYRNTTNLNYFSALCIKQCDFSSKELNQDLQVQMSHHVSFPRSTAFNVFIYTQHFRIINTNYFTCGQLERCHKILLQSQSICDRNTSIGEKAYGNGALNQSKSF